MHALNRRPNEMAESQLVDAFAISTSTTTTTATSNSTEKSGGDNSSAVPSSNDASASVSWFNKRKSFVRMLMSKRQFDHSVLGRRH